MYKIQTRDFVEAANLLLDSVATFTSTEVFSFQDFVFYAVRKELFCTLTSTHDHDDVKAACAS